MRLPTDATLLAGDGADPALIEVWRAEELPFLALRLDGLAGALDGFATATVIVAGEGAAEAAAVAARLGFRTFLVGAGAAPEGVQAATLEQTLEAARLARSRERWKAARATAR